jgi:CRISPR-associated protein Csx17
MTTSEPHEVVLGGCAPVPLANYMKALGVFRLVAEQADAEARGSWRNERFVLKTRLPQDELVQFFLNEYKPTPVISPWNGGSGFYFQEGKTKEKDPTTGKKIKTGVRDRSTAATRALDRLLNSPSGRFETYRQVVRQVREILASQKLEAAPDESAKANLIRDLRCVLQDEALSWIDAAAVVTIDDVARRLEIAFPPLLGSGGNDGNLDFSTTLLQTLFSLIDDRTGEPLPEALASLRSALFAEPARTGNGSAISQYAPGAIGGPNSGVGFARSLTGNAWDVVFGLEGTLVPSAAIVRRIGARGRGEASFSFMISRRGAFGAGAGSIDELDEQTTRGEFWGPIWGRSIYYDELLSLFREGRAIIGRKEAGNSLDFARAIGQLGVDRGIDYFERYAFEQRFGNMYLGVPLARYPVPRTVNPDLIADLAKGGWLERARSGLRGKNAAGSLVSLGRRLDEVLLRLAADCSAEAVQEALMAVGEVAYEIGRRPKLRDSVPPLPCLSEAWAVAADPKDGSHEFALAAAVASIDARAGASDGSFRLPFRRHLAPLRVHANANGGDRDLWDDTTTSRVLAVWTGRDLLRDMTAVLERRLFEAERRHFASDDEEEGSRELPLRGRRAAPLASVAAFLAGTTDDGRIARLAAGLAWARSSPRQSSAPEREDALPFAYAALKPLFEPAGIAPEPQVRRVVYPLRLVRLLRAGRAHDAVSLAQSLARGAGLPAPFARLDPARNVDPTRLAASLLFPIAPAARDRLITRAYPDLNNIKEESDVA